MFPTLAQSFRAGAFVLAACLALPPILDAAMAPTNDTCAGAFVVPGAGPFPYLTPVFDVLTAKTNGDPILPADDVCPGNSNVAHSVWFKFTPSASALYTLSLGPDTATDFGDGVNDTVLALYSAPAGCGGPFSLLRCESDTGGFTYSSLSAISTNLSAGTTYFIVAWVGQNSIPASEGLPLNLQLRVSKPVAPANDNCAGAEVIPASGPFPYLTSTVDNFLATDAANEQLSSCAGIRGVWFKFTPASTATYIFSTDTDTATTLGYTSIAILTNLTGSCGTFTQVSCVNNYDITGARARATITNTCTAGVTRYILVWDADFEAVVGEPIPGETSVQLRVSVPGPPTVNTLAASNITSITTPSAVLNMSISPNAYLSRYFLEWGPTTSYGNMTPSRQITTGLTPLQVKTETIANFTPGLTYHYRAVGSNSQGKIFGLDRTFVASTNRPVLTTPAFIADRHLLVQFTGNAGQLYAVHGSTNFVDWTELSGANDLGTGLFQYIHITSTNPPYRFYKARVR